VRRDPQVVVPNHWPLAFQFRSDRSVGFGRPCRQVQHRKHFAPAPARVQGLPPCALFSAPYSNSPKRNTESAASPASARETRQHASAFFRDVNADVHVQQKRASSQPLAFCGLSFPRRASVKSAATRQQVKRPRHRPARSRSTISSPAAKSPLLALHPERLRQPYRLAVPDLNTFAVAIFNPPPNVYT